MAIKLEDIEIFSNSLGNNFGGGGAFGGASSGGGTNLTGIPNADYLQNLANLLQQQQQQGPQLGPDEFGSYSIPASDPTYRSGFDYARSIAGGIPMSQVIAPGVSYSPEQPMGYTQAQLGPTITDLPNIVTETPPDDPSYFGTGIGGVNIPVDKDMKMPPLRDIFGGKPDMRFEIRPLKNLMNIGKLFDGGFDKDAIDKIVQERIAESMPTFEQPDLSQFVTKQDIPSFIPDIPTGREFSIDRDELIKDIRAGIDIPKYEAPDLSQFVRQENIPVPNVFDQEALRKELMEDIRGSINIPDISGLARLEDIPSFDPSVLKQDILMSIPQQQVPDVSKFVTQDDISKAIAGIDMPTFQQPDLTAYDTRLAQLEEQLAGFKQPTGGRFSVDQQLPMGLF